ncbi:MAG: hypothetical protein RIM23_05135 [Coleofasciculus sp. G3-WIS-01]|uniref:hypothetical protein n=1 Tax=Coleofasciculus sp. G3-WIS-01 TaxID=3069528 RepID=UPI003302188D
MDRSRQWQVFVAPGEDTDPLPIDNSPWHDERWVRIPKEHWNLILNFAERLDLDKAEKLDGYSWAADNNEYDYIYASAEDLESLLVFMEELGRKLELADPLVPKATEEVPDEYVNEEHLRMLNAVAVIFRESIRLRQPFRAWVE